MLKKMSILFAALAPLCLAQAGEMSPLYGKVGGWEIHRESTGCMMFSIDAQRNVLALGFEHDKAGALVGNASWGYLDPSAPYDVALQFDDQAPLAGTAKATNLDKISVVNILLDGKARFAAAILHAKSLALTFRGETVATISLADGRDAMRALVACEDGQAEVLPAPSSSSPAPGSQTTDQSRQQTRHE